MRYGLGLILVVAIGCAAPPLEAPAAGNRTPSDSQHPGITTPHGDHSPHHGGLVLMSGELHYEVVIGRDGRHAVWFSNAVREELPASVASQVSMIVTRPAASPEQLALAIDDSGESWIAKGHPVAGDGVFVMVTYVVRGERVEIEIPFVKAP